MIANKSYRQPPHRLACSSSENKMQAIRGGFTLVELVMVLVILAILASAALSVVDTQVDQARFEVTQQTLEKIDRAVLGVDHSRASDGSRVVSGFVADCGRLPHSLEELYLQPTGLLPPFSSGSPVGDSEVTISGGWNGPYLQLAIGGNSLPDGWAAALASHNSDGSLSSPAEPLSILRSLGRDQTVGGSTYDADLTLVFEAETGAVSEGLSTQEENRWQKSLLAYVYYNDNTTNPDVANGDTIVVRIYGPVADPTTGEVTLGTIQQELVDYTTEAPVSVTFSDLPIGPRIIRAYQLLNASSAPTDTDELSGDGDLEALSVPTRIVVSRETSSIQLIMREDD